MKVKSKVVEVELIVLPVAGTISVEQGRAMNFNAGDYLIIRDKRIAVASPELVAEEYALPRKRVRPLRKIGLGKTNSVLQAEEAH